MICDDIRNSLIWYYWYGVFREAFFNFMFFFMKSLKLTKTFMGGCIVTSFCIHSKSMRDIFSMYLMLLFTILTSGYDFFVIMTFIFL